MINIDTRLLPTVDESEMWLLLHIIKRMDEDNFCFPSNKTLVKDTGWEIKKLQRIKKALVDKGILEILPRCNVDRQTSNEYALLTSLIGVWVPGKKMSEVSQKSIPIGAKTDTREVSQKPPTEVLTREEVLFPLTVASKKQLQDSKVNEPQGLSSIAKKTKVPEPCHAACKAIWMRAYPDLGWDAASATALNRGIKSLREWHTNHQVDPTDAQVVDLFEHVVMYAKRERHWLSGKTLPVFASKVRELIFEMKNGKQKTSSDFYRNLNSADALRSVEPQDF